MQWHKNAGGTECDGVEIKRIGDSEVNVKIMIVLENAPDKLKVSTELAKLLDIHTETKPTVIMAIWQYVKANKLLNQDDKRLVVCDEGKYIIKITYLKHLQRFLVYKDSCLQTSLKC